MVGRLPTLKYLLAAVLVGLPEGVCRLPARNLGVRVHVYGDEVVDLHGLLFLSLYGGVADPARRRSASAPYNSRLANGSRGRRCRIQLLDQRGPMGKHRALVDRSLVGHLPGVERGGIVHQNEPREASGAAAGRFVECAEQARESRPYALARENLGGARAVAEAGELPAGREIGNDERGCVVAIVSRHDHVRHMRRAVGDELEPQRPDADPGAGRELEVFGDAPVEDEAALGVALSAKRSASPNL